MSSYLALVIGAILGSSLRYFFTILNFTFLGLPTATLLKISKYREFMHPINKDINTIEIIHIDAIIYRDSENNAFNNIS